MRRGAGTTTIFMERPSADSMADWISIFVPSALKVGWGWSWAVSLWPVVSMIISRVRRSIR